MLVKSINALRNFSTFILIFNDDIKYKKLGFIELSSHSIYYFEITYSVFITS